MTKPRFTPDPIPDGLDPELAAYLQRQFDRIDDWWPKDLEDRVKALEEIASRVGGVWPIVDYSSVSFIGEAVEIEPECVLTSVSNPTESLPWPNITGLNFLWLWMKPDGTKLYASSRTETNNVEKTRGVAEFTLSTPFDITTMANDGSNLTYTLWNDDGGWSSLSNSRFPQGLAFSEDGTKCFLIDGYPNGVLDLNPDAIVRYDLSTPWDISTMSHTRAKIYYTDAFATVPIGLSMSNDGKHFYVANDTPTADYSIYQVSFDTEFDLESSDTTASYDAESELTAAGELPASGWKFLFVNNKGTRIVAGVWTDVNLYVFGMTTPHDISTASYLYKITIPGGGASETYGLYVDPDCEYALFVGNSRKFWRYEIG